MKAVVLDTPGLIDIRSFTSFGVNSKPMSTSPLGYFGTGLKYAIAILVRMGQNVTLYIGQEKKYTFYGNKSTFRDKDFDFIRMKREDWHHSVSAWFKPKYEQLPFTTELGKTWKLWEAFRELYTNTLDENGISYVVNDLSVLTPMTSDMTRIVVSGEAFVQEFFDKDRNFLPDGLRERISTERLQVFDRPSNYVYYRGMRVMDLDKPSTLTYNFLCQIDLAENRQAASPYKIKEEIGNYILESEEEDTIKRVLEGKDTFESNINFEWSYRLPSASFRRASYAATAPNASALAVVRSHEPRKQYPNPLKGWPRPWQSLVTDNGLIIRDSYGVNVMKIETLDLSTEAQRYILALLQKDLNESEVEDFFKDRPEDLSLTDTKLEAEIRETINADEDNPVVF